MSDSEEVDIESELRELPRVGGRGRGPFDSFGLSSETRGGGREGDLRSLRGDRGWA